MAGLVQPFGGTVAVTANADNYIPASGTLVVTS